VKKTNKVIVLTSTRAPRLAGEIAAIINEEAFDDLDGPIVRLTSLDTPVRSLHHRKNFFAESF